MAQKTGRLTINPQGNSILNGIRLAIRGAANPLIEATNVIRGNGFNNNSFVTVTGDDGFLGNIPVFFITNVVPAAANRSAGALDLEIAGELKDEAVTAEMTEEKSNGEKMSDDGSLKRRGRRKKKNIVAAVGGATLAAGIVLLILSRKTPKNR